MTDLIDRLEEATEGSRDLDEQIALASGIRHRSRRDGRGRSKGREWFVDSHGGVETWANHAPYYTTSLDAALTLVPEGLGWQVWGEPKATKYGGEASIEHPTDGWHFCTEANGRTPALALCIAALKARQDDAGLRQPTSEAES